LNDEFLMLNGGWSHFLKRHKTLNSKLKSLEFIIGFNPEGAPHGRCRKD
jgi:hypothetical protein